MGSGNDPSEARLHGAGRKGSGNGKIKIITERKDYAFS